MFSNFLSAIGNGSVELINQGGYLGIFLLSLADRILLSLVPSEIVLPLAGFLAGQGEFNLFVIILTTLGGNVLGDIILYYISAKGGRWLVEKYGKYFFISHHDLEHTDRLFAKHGGKLVIIGRLLPIVRTFIAIPAGVSKMPVKKFIGYSFIGFLPYNLLLIFAGFKSGQFWDKIKPILDRLEFFILGAILAVIAWYIFKHLKRKHLTHE